MRVYPRIPYSKSKYRYLRIGIRGRTQSKSAHHWIWFIGLVFLVVYHHGCHNKLVVVRQLTKAIWKSVYEHEKFSCFFGIKRNCWQILNSGLISFTYVNAQHVWFFFFDILKRPLSANFQLVMPQVITSDSQPFRGKCGLGLFPNSYCGGRGLGWLSIILTLTLTLLTITLMPTAPMTTPTSSSSRTVTHKNKIRV